MGNPMVLNLLKAPAMQPSVFC
ncbi:MAG: hypothetical protein ACK4SS_08025 [Cypionkella sp.]